MLNAEKEELSFPPAKACLRRRALHLGGPAERFIRQAGAAAGRHVSRFLRPAVFALCASRRGLAGPSGIAGIYKIDARLMSHFCRFAASRTAGLDSALNSGILMPLYGIPPFLQ